MTDQTAIEQGYYWKLVRRAIERIDAAGGRDLSLDEIAAEAGLSPAHFQRVFSRWAGISPKRFQQYLTLGHARRLLAERRTTLAAADEAGLSGPGRLHDLVIRWDAMRPGDLARQGEGLALRWGWCDGPFGRTLAMATDLGLAGLAFADEIGDAAAMSDLRGRWPRATFEEDPRAVRPLVDAVFAGRGARAHVIGAPFQIKVWEALMRIPSGHVTTYGDIARAIGTPRAHRAVGAAVGRNPVALLIPCHRALRQTGELGGYHWGLPVKRALLAWETLDVESRSGTAS